MTSTDISPDSELASPSEATIHDNKIWSGKVSTALSILIPTYKDDPLPLITALGGCDNIDQTEIIIYDDGSNEEATLNALKDYCAGLHFPVRIIMQVENRGRAYARNQLLEHARSEWVLLLDADMLPDAPDFLTLYINVAKTSVDPKLVVGGFSLKNAPNSPEFALHRWQSEKSECIPADIRNTHPGRYVFTSNVMAHKDLFRQVPFDEAFSGWGWEDVDWGLRIAKAYPVIHIDNTATHLGLDTVDVLLRKYGNSGRNFRRICEKHPEELKKTPLYTISHALKPVPGKAIGRGVCKFILTNNLIRFPLKMRGNSLKLWRALVYAQALK